MGLIRRSVTFACLVTLIVLGPPARADGRLSPQGGTITSVGATAGGGLTGGATGGPAYLGLITTCSSGQGLQWNGSAWACADAGDITSVTAGLDLTGGGATGAVTLAVDETLAQHRVGGTCAAPNAIRAIAQDGTVTCTSGTGSVTSITAGSGLSGGTITSTGTIALAIAPTTCASGSAETATSSLGVGTCNVFVNAAGTGLALTGSSLAVSIAGGTCSAGQHASALSATGTLSCTADTDPGLSGLTTNTILKAGSSTTAINSLLTDDGTTLKYNTTKFTVASATGNATIAGTLDITGAATADSGARIVTAAGTGLSKTTNSLAVNIAGASCSAGSFMSALGATGTGTCTAGSTGTVTSITCSTGLSCTASNPITASGTITLSIAGASCSAGSHVSAISATGTGTCSADTGSGLSGLTTNAILRAGSSTTAINANETDDGVNFLTTNQVVIAHSGTISYTGLTNQAVFNYDSSTGILTLAGQRTGGLSEIDLATSSSGAATTQLSLTSSAASFTHGVTADGGLRVFTIAGSGLTSVANTVTLNMAGASCSAGSFVSAITATGGTTCTAASGTISGLTTNKIVKASSSTTIANSSMSDDGTNVTLTENVNGTTANFTNGTQPATFTAYANGSGRTTNVNALDNENFATYDTTAAARTGYGLQAWSYGTRSAGANNLTNIAILANAFNGQLNYSFYGQTGQFYQAATGEFGGALAADTTLKIGVGGDAAGAANTATLATNAGTTCSEVRDSTNHVEAEACASSSGAFFGAYTNNSLFLQTNATNALKIDASQNTTILGTLTTSSIITDNGTKPTLSTCGTSSVTSNAGAYSFDIAVTAGTVTSCTATFAVACPHTPTCFSESYDETKNNVYVSAHSTTAVTVSATSSPSSNLNGNSFGVFCICH